MRIAIDLDGVVCDFLSMFLSLGEHIIGKKIDKSVINDWDITKSGVMSRKEFSKVWNEFVKLRLFRFLSIIDDARKYCNLLGKEHDITFVTCRPSWKDADNWLRFNGFSNWCLTTLPVGGDKAKYINKNDYDVIIEDKLSTLKSVNDYTVKILIDRQYNRGKANGIYRAKDWSEIYYYIKKYRRR